MEKRFLKLDEVMLTTGLSKPSIYRWMERGEFPQQYKLGEKSVAWLSLDIEKWIDEKITAPRPLRSVAVQIKKKRSA